MVLMAQATYDTFNLERLSKYSGSSRYSRRNLFSRVGLAKGNPFKYEAVKYIYAASSILVPEAFILKPLLEDAWFKESNWMGYVAVATDEGKIALGRRDILVAWRGTVQHIEGVKDLDLPLVSASKIVGISGDNAKVHEGFLSLSTSYNQHSTFNKTSARYQVLSELKKRVEQYKDEDISITVVGHSLGGALSILNAADIVSHGHNEPRNQPNKTCPMTALSYGCPRVGDLNFKNTLQSMHDLRILNLINVPDIIPHFPPIGYTSVGVDLWVNSRTSPYLNYPGDFMSWHNLEAAYLHPVALQRGKTVKRDISLVNKNSDALKDKYSIPTHWWCEKNKGMVQMNNGSWKLQDHEKDDHLRNVISCRKIINSLVLVLSEGLS